ncbi:MAG: LytTR family DNA-binding domain-containing protein [Alphaproteobacteria bacterium]|nr:LytTR family DNA-binding domain-containing protein [Alphaproteobacteria bacterium]MDP6622479.1 LytTR family DNA-binding domain-containing protein [Alphaproteobacteria bacterium]
MRSLQRLRQDASPNAPQTAPVALAAQLSRMPEGLDGTLLCLEMEDHYVRVHTTQGSGLVLQRLSDAMRELAGHDGQQVHRSWWVARAAVSGHERDGGRRILLLSNGLKVPVSRSYLAALRDADWLD